jgi:hypothetical protein
MIELSISTKNSFLIVVDISIIIKFESAREVGGKGLVKSTNVVLV